ncbi:MAG: hypothetical protein F6K00_14905 [Leptolyngbya sp. SIOISBB]|nr:hypothetical protein [Leptolyngbya sp. SIOISBB]
MKRFVLVGFLATLLVSALAIEGTADSSESPSPSASASDPIVVRLALRDRMVIVTAAQVGRQYSVLETSGEVLHADLSENQFAEQYPELAELLQPAIAETNSELMMLAPVVK